MEELKGELLEMVTLRGPSGDTWTTELVQTEKDYIFQNGWEAFARDHSLNDGDFLVFKYSKRSTFEVLIFDPSGCETENCYFVESKSNKHAKQCCSMRDSDQLTKKDQVISESSDESKESEGEEVQQSFLPKSKRTKTVTGIQHHLY